MRPLEKSLEKLDDVRKKKLSEMIGGSGAGPVSTSSGSNYFIFYFCAILLVLKITLSLNFYVLFSDINHDMPVTIQTSGGSGSSVQVGLFFPFKVMVMLCRTICL